MTRNTPAAPGLLWDLDNVDPGLRALPSLAMAFRESAGCGAALFAAGHSDMIGRRRKILRQLGFTVIRGGVMHNGADHVLLAQGRSFVRRKGRPLIIASGDKIFSRLSRRHEVTLYVLRLEGVSQRLLGTANSVVVFEMAGSTYLPRALDQRRG